MVQPVYRSLRTLYLLLLLLAYSFSSCKTTEPKGDITPTQTKREKVTIEKESDLLTDKELVDNPVNSAETLINWLEEAEKAWFIRKDPEYTEFCLDQIDLSLLQGEDDLSLYRLLCRKIYSSSISWDDSFLDHRNISRLYLDHDDLWIGTWAGGIGRFSLPLHEMTLIKEAKESLQVETIYSFLRQGHIIHMAGYGPIYEYDKRTSQFTEIYPQGPERINGLELYKDKLYASTVNRGIWVDLGIRSWQKLTIAGLGSQINFLHSDKMGKLLIGTADSGILVYDGFTLKNLNTLYPDFKGINVTTLFEKDDFLLVGTFGEGGYLINRRTGKTDFFSENQGNISSDYVLCTSMNDSYAFWGTLGGGITAWSLKEEKPVRFIGMEEGLLSLDVSSLALYGKTLLIANLGQGLIMMREEIIEKKL